MSTRQISHIMDARAAVADILDRVERGEEHVARDAYGDARVDSAIAVDLAADGFDLESCLEHANGYGR